MEHNLHILAVSQPKLLTAYHHLAVFAIAEKGNAVLRPEHDHRVLDVINQTLVVVIVQINVAVIYVVQVEWKAVDLAGLSEEELVLLVHEHVVGSVYLGLILETVLPLTRFGLGGGGFGRACFIYGF